MPPLNVLYGKGNFVYINLSVNSYPLDPLFTRARQSNTPSKKNIFFSRNVDVEEEVKFVQKVASVVRSTRADYNLPNKTKTELYLQVFCETSAQVIIKVF